MSKTPEGFTPWGGGNCPAEAKGRQTEVIFRDGSKETLDGESFRWTHCTPAQDWHDFDIVAYRVDPPAAVKQDLTTAHGDGCGACGDGCNGGSCRLAQESPQPEAKAGADERKDAEQAYTISAFDYCSAPVGSRDWVLFWKGWQASREQPKPAEGGAVAYTVRCVHETTNTADAGIYFLEVKTKVPPKDGATLYAEPPAAATRAEEVEALAYMVCDACNGKGLMSHPHSADPQDATLCPGCDGKGTFGPSLPMPLRDLLNFTEHCISAADEGADYAVPREWLDAMTTIGIMEKIGRNRWAPSKHASAVARRLAGKGE